MVDRETCSTHLRKLSSIPFFGTVSSEAFSAWTTAAKNCDDTAHLIRAVDSILRARALPQSPEDITDAVNATRIHEQPAEIYSGGCCGCLVPGWTYLGHHPGTPVTPAEERLEADPPKFLIPSRCVNGWIHRTIWIPVMPARIDEDGSPVRQPYHYAGRCKCQPGGTI